MGIKQKSLQTFTPQQLVLESEQPEIILVSSLGVDCLMLED